MMLSKCHAICVHGVGVVVGTPEAEQERAPVARIDGVEAHLCNRNGNRAHAPTSALQFVTVLGCAIKEHATTL